LALFLFLKLTSRIPQGEFLQFESGDLHSILRSDVVHDKIAKIKQVIKERRMRYLLVCIFISIGLAGCKQSQNSPATSSQNGTATSSPAIPEGASPAQNPAPVADPNAPPGATAEKPKTDACALLTTEEVKAVQGEPIKETKLSARSDGGFSISQCFFTLPTFTNSISLAVTQQADGQGARDPKEFWRETFHRDAAEVRREREREREREKEREGEEEEEVEPERIRGVGDEAFWMGSRVGGALYVLKGNSYLRISIGGAADQESKIKRSKALALKAVSRL
jgi:hypothetical protein